MCHSFHSCDNPTFVRLTPYSQHHCIYYAVCKVAKAMQSSSADLACCLTTPSVAEIMWPRWQMNDRGHLKHCPSPTLSTTNSTGLDWDQKWTSATKERRLIIEVRTGHVARRSLVFLVICHIVRVMLLETECRPMNYTSEGTIFIPIW